jgi:hypothetical protein
MQYFLSFPFAFLFLGLHSFSLVYAFRFRSGAVRPECVRPVPPILL